MTAPATPRAKQPLWARLLAAIGVIVVGFPAAVLVSLTIAMVRDGVEPIGVTFLASGVIGLVTVVLLYRVARGDVLSRGATIAMAAGVVIALGAVSTAYVSISRSFDGYRVRSLRSELRVLAGEQEAHFEKHGTFSADTALLFKGQGSRHVAVTIEHADSSSWRASATSRPATKRTCRITGTRAGISDPVCD